MSDELFDVWLCELRGIALPQAADGVARLFGVGLPLAQQLVAAVPCVVKRRVVLRDAQSIAAALASLGGRIELRPHIPKPAPVPVIANVAVTPYGAGLQPPDTVKVGTLETGSIGYVPTVPPPSAFDGSPHARIVSVRPPSERPPPGLEGSPSARIMSVRPPAFSMPAPPDHVVSQLPSWDPPAPDNVITKLPSWDPPPEQAPPSAAGPRSSERPQAQRLSQRPSQRPPSVPAPVLPRHQPIVLEDPQASLSLALDETRAADMPDKWRKSLTLPGSSPPAPPAMRPASQRERPPRVQAAATSVAPPRLSAEKLLNPVHVTAGILREANTGGVRGALSGHPLAGFLIVLGGTTLVFLVLYAIT